MTVRTTRILGLSRFDIFEDGDLSVASCLPVVTPL